MPAATHRRAIGNNFCVPTHMLLVTSVVWPAQYATVHHKPGARPRRTPSRGGRSSVERLTGGLVLPGVDVDCGVPPSRRLPLLPDEVRRLVETEKKFTTGKEDVETVVETASNESS